jgi:hypothetical protein
MEKKRPEALPPLRPDRDVFFVRAVFRLQHAEFMQHQRGRMPAYRAEGLVAVATVADMPLVKMETKTGRKKLQVVPLNGSFQGQHAIFRVDADF